MSASDDLSTRLRAVHPGCSGDCLFREAADEIERLKAAAAVFSDQVACRTCDYEDRIEYLERQLRRYNRDAVTEPFIPELGPGYRSPFEPYGGR